MAANVRYDSMRNRAKMSVMKQYFPELVKGLVEYIYDNKMENKKEDAFAYEVGRHAICGSTISDYLKQEEMLDTVNNIVRELMFSKKNIDAARVTYDTIDLKIKKNKPFAEKLLAETFVRSCTDPRLVASVNGDGSVAKRLMMKLGGALNIGKDCRRDAMFTEILRGMNHETFARRNRNGDARTMGAGNIDTSNIITDDVMAVAKEKNISLANELTRKFEEIKQKAIDTGRSAIAITGIMSVCVFGASALSPDNNMNPDVLIQKHNIEQVVHESMNTSHSTISLDEITRLTDAFSDRFEGHDSFDAGMMDADIAFEELDLHELSPFQAQVEQEMFEAQFNAIEKGIMAGFVDVVQGDNLTKISEKIVDSIYGDYTAALTDGEYNKEVNRVVADLVNENGIQNPDLIFPDQAVKIPDSYKTMFEADLETRVNDLAEKLDQKQTSKIAFKM
ncbi:hypothetical protein OTK49_00925 [Vibrio coralliirubri]|uniref:LysM peptidoglycan-binding domain-containing protein n=1 Tax=Vibrio coralliirubri TaxID=1516159 RepID=UPI002284070D|nr:hypothetical protein [Vibrio coralliirubri]MCY9861094.1 hypothetical protein [Vibrio coralliirubri]